MKLRGLLWDGMRPDLIVCHEKDTDIYTPETGWIKNQDHPTAKNIHAHDAYKVEFEDGTTEVVSSDHRYLTEEGWKYIWELNPNDNILKSREKDGLLLIEQNIQSGLKQTKRSMPILTKVKQKIWSGKGKS